MDRVRTYGIAGAGGVFVITTVVVALGSRSGEVVPPGTLPRGLVLGALLIVPAIVALLGVARRDAVLLAAAGLAALAPAWLSMVTFPLVIPAVLLLVAGAAAVRPPSGRRWLLVLVIVALQAGAIAALFGMTETRCWLAYDSPTGLVYRSATEAETHGPMGGLGGPVAGGCDGGSFTERGIALAGVLVGGVIAVSFGAPSRRREATERWPG